jgi:hypothetical protein
MIISAALKCLKKEDELSLSYLYGQKLEDMEHLKNREAKLQGVVLRSLAFIKYLLVRAKLRQKNIRGAEVLLYAGTNNQLNSIIPTIESLTKDRVSRNVLVETGLDSEKLRQIAGVVSVQFDVRVILHALVLFFIKAPRLYYYLYSSKRFTEINLYFNVFCQAYVYLPYFLALLASIKPKLIVVSNDHNTSNRCLRLVAKHLGIRTLYMQHASVSELFPPLNFDYALLDGQVALNTYSKVSQGLSTHENYTAGVSGRTTIVLSGQQKEVGQVAIKNVNEKIVVGLAVNALDDFASVRKVLEYFVNQNVNCVVRTHPYQSPEFLASLTKMVSSYDAIGWSDSRSQSLSDFFQEIQCLIAANSSIHLEAALAGLPTFYLELCEEVHLPDYYGYVKNGVSYQLNDEFEIVDLQKGIRSAHSTDRTEAIKRYSATYNTTWQHREGELSSWIMKQILSDQDFSKYFHCEKIDNFLSLYRLRENKSHAYES